MNINKSVINKFISRWRGKGDEKSDTQKFWLEVLRYICGAEDPESLIDFEKRVTLEHKSFIDAYIPSTRVLIEQKSIDIDLGKTAKQSDGSYLTPFEQAKRYYDWIKASERGRWIIVCNFKELWIYDLEMPHAKPEVIELENLDKEFNKLNILVDANAAAPKEIRELEISVKAGELVKTLYDAVKPRYIKPDSPEALRSLNIFCVRIVFLLYAEDSGLFNKGAFHDYLKANSHDARRAMIDLFEVLSQPESERDVYLNDELKAFPYVNGGLFEDMQIEIPNLNQPDDEPLRIILEDMSNGFDWSNISPTIFGALFESTLNPETRRSGGMHYTSIENIHKVIDPLFLDNLKSELVNVLNMSSNSTREKNTRNKKLLEFQEELANLTFLDPACGSGNFLTETFLSLRELENKIIAELTHGQRIFAEGEFSPVKVSIGNFYGIEINDFAVAVARTALWIAEYQMIQKTHEIIDFHDDYLPLKTYNNIIEGNALKLDWNDVVPKEKLKYIMGNPPFVGARLMNAEQKADLVELFKGWENVGNLDYVSCWYKKASDMMKNTEIMAAFVSTNSITQGEAVTNLWQPLFDGGFHIDFAWKTFIWDNESEKKAHVYCVIIGFSCVKSQLQYALYNIREDGIREITKVVHINASLLDMVDVFIKSRQHPLCDVPEIGIGNKPIDGGNYLFKKDEMEDFIKKEPASEKYFHPWYGADEFINNRPRYCLYLGNCTPHELKNMPECLKRVEAVRNYRLASTSAPTKKLADTPTKFHVTNMPDGNYILMPLTSSENRKYIPIGFMSPEVITSNAVSIIPNATLYHFGVLTSRVHMAWTRVVCGRLEMRYRYSNTIVYNNFPWPSPSDKQRVKIEGTAQKILNARALYPESSFASLYDDVTMPVELRKAHRLNDAAVCEAYGFDKDISEADIVAKLMRMYQGLTLR